MLNRRLRFEAYVSFLGLIIIWAIIHFTSRVVIEVDYFTSEIEASEIEARADTVVLRTLFGLIKDIDHYERE